MMAGLTAGFVCAQKKEILRHLEAATHDVAKETLSRELEQLLRFPPTEVLERFPWDVQVACCLTDATKRRTNGNRGS